MDRSKVVIMGIIVAGLGIATGYGIASSKKTTDSTQNNVQNSAMTEAGPNTVTKAADLRVLLNSLEKEHVELASGAVRNGFDGRPDFSAITKSLDNNSVELSKAVGSIYGPKAEQQFLDLWRSHIGFFVDYTVAAKKGDKKGMDDAVANLGGYIDGAATFFSQANPNLPKEAVKALVTEHVLLLKKSVDAYATGNFAESYTQQNLAYNQIGKIADALSGAIVKQYPNKF